MGKSLVSLLQKESFSSGAISLGRVCSREEVCLWSDLDWASSKKISMCLKLAL